MRYVASLIAKDLETKMVLVGGPRQVGKTTLAKQLLDNDRSQGYLNWDTAEDRELILKRTLPAADFWVFDELHKYKHWRNYLKGLYDGVGKTKKILVTGSARLEHFRHGGDSLQGRYHYWRLHPLSVRELGGDPSEMLSALMDLGGFPEPFFSGSKIEARRWSRQYRERLLRQEVTDLTTVHDLGQMELLMLRLPELVGSPLSVNSLREDLQVSHRAVTRWLEIFENLYAIFRVQPFGAPKIRAVKKERKHYHLDWTLIPDPGPRFENLVACHLLKWVHFQQDALGRDVELCYFRDVDLREVDFVIAERGRPIAMIEAKYGKNEPSPHLRYLKQRFAQARAYQISATDPRDLVTVEGIHLCPASTFLAQLV